jgi:alpha-ketoglutarate-dependent taurine dioxygenase
MSIEVKPMNASIGAEIRGIDLSTEIDPEDAAELKKAWLDHQVLVFRDMDIAADEQRVLVSCFGELQQPRSKIQRANPDILYVPMYLLTAMRVSCPKAICSSILTSAITRPPPPAPCSMRSRSQPTAAIQCLPTCMTPMRHYHRQ